VTLRILIYGCLHSLFEIFFILTTGLDARNIFEMFIIPWSILTSFPKPNYVDPVSRGQVTSVVSGVMMSFTTLFVLTRLYQRIFVRRWFGPDDLCIIMGYVSNFQLENIYSDYGRLKLCALGVTITTIIGNERFDWNLHVWDVHEENYQCEFTR
jgi:hypothetical protein